MPYDTEPRRRHFSPVRAFPPFAAAALVLAGACSRDHAEGDAVLLPDAEGVFTPAVVGTAAVPPSESGQVALLADERVACVFDFYETRIRCMDAEGAVVGVFGRQGEGPGEFGSSDSPYSLHLVRGEDGTLGIYDSRLSRFTVFEPTGAYVSEARMPFMQPRRSFGTVLTGTVWRGWIADSLMIRYDVNVTSGEVVRQDASPSGPWGVECEEGSHGIPDRAEGWVFQDCADRLIFVDNTGDATVLSVPTELPDERDVARREEELRIGWAALQGTMMGPEVMARALQLSSDGTFESFVDETLEDYRSRPRPYSLGGGHQLFDPANRYWIATQRDTHEWSYLDVYENAEYAGSVRVRDRLRGFDVFGSTLVVLVERQVGPDDADGVPDRALDWYEIGGLGLGSARLPRP